MKVNMSLTREALLMFRPPPKMLDRRTAIVLDALIPVGPPKLDIAGEEFVRIETKIDIVAADTQQCTEEVKILTGTGLGLAAELKRTQEVLERMEKAAQKLQLAQATVRRCQDLPLQARRQIAGWMITKRSHAELQGRASIVPHRSARMCAPDRLGGRGFSACGTCDPSRPCRGITTR